MTRRNGFTLVELLVVIGIIAILAAVLFPVFGRAREKARQASCVSNLKQIAQAARMYESEHGHLPLARTFVSGEPRTVIPALLPEIKSREVFACPSSRDENMITTEDRQRIALDYSFRAEAQGRELAHCARPWDYPFFLDLSCGTWTWNNRTIVNCDKNEVLPDNWGRHNGGVNIAFLDGHVKWRKTDSLIVALEGKGDYSVKFSPPAATPEKPARAPSLPDGVYNFKGRATAAGSDIKLEGTLTPAEK